MRTKTTAYSTESLHPKLTECNVRICKELLYGRSVSRKHKYPIHLNYHMNKNVNNNVILTLNV